MNLHSNWCLLFVCLFLLLSINKIDTSEKIKIGKDSDEVPSTHKSTHAHHRHHFNNYPKILNGNTNITAYEGDTAILPCEVANLENNHVIWFKIGNDGIPSTLTVGYEQFSRNMRYRVVRTSNQNDASGVESWDFEIRKLNKSDKGLYQCHIKTSHKNNIIRDVYLDVLSETEKPSNAQDSFLIYSSSYVADRQSSLPKDVEKIESRVNSWIRLKCNESPSSLYRSAIRNTNDIQWYKDGKVIEQDAKRFKKSSSLNTNDIEFEFYSTNPKDTGFYQCKRNSKVLKNIFLHVYENKSYKNSINLFVIIYSTFFALLRNLFQ